MQQVKLGRSGLSVSRLCLGTMSYGADATPPWCDEAEARRLIDAFVDAGGNFIDTANVYTAGQAEAVLGRALAGRREAVVIATKAAGATGAGPNDQGLSRAHLTAALEASLRRLGTDHVDLYYMHRADPATPIEETMATLAGFVRAGKVRYLGCSNFSGSQIVEAQWAAERVGGVPLVALQPRYSLISREIETDTLPAAQRQGLGAVPYGVLAGGVLSGKYRAGETPDAADRYGGGMGLRGSPGMAAAAAHSLSARNLAVADAVRDVATELGAAPSAVATAWVLSRRGVASAIIGPRMLAQLPDYLAGAALTLPADALKRLSAASRPPG